MANKQKRHKCHLPPIDMGPKKQRARITTRLFLAAVQVVLEANRKYWPLTVRRVHYLLLNDPPPRHDARPESLYGNTQQCYSSLSRLLLRARLSGEIDRYCVTDETRPQQTWPVFDYPEAFIDRDIENFLRGYWRNLMQDQPHHIEIVLEKNALRTVIEEVAREFTIPVVTARGKCSFTPRDDIANRFRASGKQKLILLMLTDFDPDGLVIASSFPQSLRDDFHARQVEPYQVALLARDIEEHNLPSDLEAKPTSPTYRKFVQQYGTHVAELDACPVDLLQSKLRTAIESVIDIKTFQQQVAQEQADLAMLEERRRRVLTMLEKEFE